MSALQKWRDRELTRLKTDMDCLFDGICRELGLPPLCRSFVAPLSLDMRETAAEILVTVVLPKIEAKDIELTLENEGLDLAIRRTRSGEGLSESEAWRTRVTLPCRVSADQAQATFKDGVLRISLPKLPHSGIKRLSIQCD